MYKSLKINQLLTKSGQILIETTILLPLVGACFILCLLFFQVHAQHLWMDHQLYQGLICVAKGNAKINCENKMKEKIKSFLWTGNLKKTTFYKRGEIWRGSFIWQTQFWRIQFRKKIKIGS